MRFWQEHNWLFIDGTRNLEHLCLFSYFLELPCIISPQSPLSLALRFKNWVSDSNVFIVMFGNREREVYRMQTRLWVSDSNVVIVIFGNREREVHRMQARLGPLLPREVLT